MTAHVRQMDRYGCAIACCAMVRGVSYAEVAETFGPPDRGFTHDVWQQYLALYGFAIQHLFSHDPVAGKSRSPWPLEPWAPLHLCSVDAGCGFGSHLVVLRDDGIVLDPAADAPRRLADYASVNFMVGIFYVGAQPGTCGHLVPASLATARDGGTGAGSGPGRDEVIRDCVERAAEFWRVVDGDGQPVAMPVHHPSPQGGEVKPPTPDPRTEALAALEGQYLIRKGGYYYRPNRAGYTASPHEAGRYTLEEAEAEASVEPWHMSAVKLSDALATLSATDQDGEAR